MKLNSILLSFFFLFLPALVPAQNDKPKSPPQPPERRRLWFRPTCTPTAA